MSRIKVLHTVGWLGFGGLEGGVIKLANGLNRRLFSPYVMALRGFNQKVLGRLAADVVLQTFHKKPGRDWSLVWKLATFFRRQGIDVVHSHNWETFLYSYLAARIANTKVYMHGEHGRDSQELSDDPFKTRVKSFLAHHSDRLTTVSADIKMLMTEQWKIAPEKITVLPNGIDLEKFSPAPDRASLKSRLGFPAASFLIGTVVSCVRPVKDLPTLLKAFVEIKRRVPEAKLAIVGGMENSFEANNPAQDVLEIKNFIDRNSLRDAVIWAGQQGSVEKYLQAFDLYVNSSLYEGMSNTLLEAMGCGAAIVATRVGGTPMIVRDGENGLLVPPAAPEAMANAVCRLVETAQLKERLGRAGRKYVESHHPLETFVCRHEEIYLEEFWRKNQSRQRAFAAKNSLPIAKNFPPSDEKPFVEKVERVNV